MRKVCLIYNLFQEHDGEKACSGFVNDTSQLYLLQDAYISLQKFFDLLNSYQSQPAATDEIQLMSGSSTFKEQLEFVAKSILNGNSIVSKQHNIATKPIDERVNLVLAEYKSVLGYQFNQADECTESNLSQQMLQTVLTEELLLTQDKLHRLQSRLDLFESMQSQIMCDYLHQQYLDKINPRTVDGKDIFVLNNDSTNSEQDCRDSHSHVNMSAEGIGSGEKFDEILQELQALELQISERSQKDYAFGLLLDRQLTIVDNSSSDSPHFDGTIKESFDTAMSRLISLFKELQSVHLQSLDNIQNKDIHQFESVQQFQKQLLQQHENEQIESEHSELLKLTLELQILREQNLLLTKQHQDNNDLLEQNRELQKIVHENETRIQSRTYSEAKNTVAKNDLSGEAVLLNQNQSRHDVRGTTGNVDENQNPRLREQYQSLFVKHQQLQQQYDILQKENLRAKSTIQLTEAQIKSILQDSLVLHQQVHALEEDNCNQNNIILQLTQQCHEAVHFKLLSQEQEQQMLDLKRELMKKDIVIQELEENMSLLNNYHSDLLQAERTIELLETKISDYSVELEKGLIINNQLHKLRDIVQKKTNENNSLLLKIYHLENSNQDIPYYNLRIQDMVEEISDTKMKIEKIPGLLAEIARLRGSSRASLKSLQEQDKLLINYKSRIKLLEKENLLLKHDNQSLQDLENKLKDANNEIKRLLNLLNEIQLLKANAKNVEEEKKIMEGQYKKMRKFMRQSVLTTPIAASGGSGNSSHFEPTQ